MANYLVSVFFLMSILIGQVSQAEPLAHPVSPDTNASIKSLDKLVTDYTEKVKHLDPFNAPFFNIEEDLAKFGDYLSPELKAKAKALVKSTLRDLKKVDSSKLDEKYRLTYDLFKEDLENSLESFEYPSEAMSIDHKSTRLTSYLDDSSPSLTAFPFTTVKNYHDFVARSEGFGPYIDRQIKVLKDGIKQKVVLNCIVAEKVPGTYVEGLKKEVEKNAFYRPLSMMPKEFSQKDRDQITADFKQMISKNIIPGFEKFDKFFKTEYLPKCRKEFGYGSLPNGKKWYKYNVKVSTNTNKTPDEIHRIGLSEVARIKQEMIHIKDRMGFKGTFKEFLKFIVDDPKYYFKSPSEALESFQTVRKKIAVQIPKFFNLIPKSDYRVVEAENPEAPSASYNAPTELKPFGRFVVNTMNLKSTSIPGVTTLSLHEAIPGHHFQLALAFEMKDKITEYQRKIYNSVAFVEGWALYSEYLGREMGLYSDDVQYLGHLSDEMLRACRLVVDTGIHSKGWSKQKSVDFMADNLASDIKEIESEVERYSVWPGQALGYKIGQLKIIELRKKAEKELKNTFDIKKFHDVVLGQGTLSLFVLEKRVNQWISSQKMANQPQ